ncbi:hypothetical protein CHS0354_038692 [Potamilus streckersoni]|uniref:Uncharacterized protein n=1 Tax=Potamilus streckersoni TaxID=2493646 RepID=A0AAE0SFM6_9BIVA|nr:hypothetical protein CHS0354_038692 [Potamilus streckersoni]
MDLQDLEEQWINTCKVRPGDEIRSVNSKYLISCVRTTSSTLPGLLVVHQVSFQR